MGASASTLALRQGVIRLYEDKELSPTDDAFWTQLFNAPVTAEDIWAVVSPKDIRSMITKAPRNMHTLVLRSIEYLVAATADAALPMPRTSQYPVLNSIRILTRVFPFLCEDRTYAWADELWNKPLPSALDAAGAPRPEALNSDGTVKTAADALIDGVFKALFLPGFTLAPTVNRRKDGTFFIIWETGIAARSAPPSTVEIDAHRTEALKLLLVLNSGGLYLNPDVLRTDGIAWSLHVLRRATPTVVMALLASLLNVICNYDPVGYGMPYNYMLFSDHKEALAEVATQVLLVLVDYEYPLRTGADDDKGEHATMGAPTERPKDPQEEDLARAEVPAAAGSADGARSEPFVPSNLGVPNIFQEYLSRIHRTEDFDVLIAGLVRLLHVPIDSANTYLPGSRKSLKFFAELLFLLWRTIEINRRFAAYLLRDAALPKLVLALMYYLSECRRDEAKYGVVHLVGFIMLLLSADRTLGVRLNQPYKEVLALLKLPAFDGNYADVVILCFHRVITDGGRPLAPLYDCLLTIIANIAPYVKSISSLTAQKLIGLLRLFTAPSFLFANPVNCELSVILVEIINSMLQYQLDGNTRLVYAIVKNRTLFHALAALDLPTALAKQQASAAAQLNLTLPTMQDSLDGTALDSAPSSAASAAAKTPPATPSAAAPPVAAATAAAAASPTGAAPASEPPTLTTRRGFPVVAPARFVPTEEWLKAYKHRLKLVTTLRLLQVLVPQVDQICAEHPTNSEDAVLKFLAGGTLVGLLPLPTPIMVRRYKPTAATRLWMTVQLWGVIYLSHLNPPVWYGTQIALFIIHSVQPPV